MARSVDYRAMGERLRERRRQKKLTQEQLAERADISSSFVGHLERAEKIPSLETIVDLCAALEISVDWLVRGKRNLNCDQSDCELYAEIRRVLDSFER